MGANYHSLKRAIEKWLAVESNMMGLKEDLDRLGLFLFIAGALLSSVFLLSIALLIAIFRIYLNYRYKQST